MELASACKKVALAFEQAGWPIAIVQHQQSARTAQEAADVWAAAGTPVSVFNIAPDTLAKLTGARIICVK